MNPKEFEREMRKGECYHSLRVPPGAWIVIRVDGRSFSRFTESRFEKPFDAAFRDHMIGAARALMLAFNGLYAYTESDEISLLVPKNWDMFDREVEKIVSLTAAIASAAFTHSLGEPAAFDGRLWVGADAVTVVDYFRWRQFDATRCCLNGWCYWTLRNEGASVSEATTALDRKSVSDKNEMLFSRGINFNDVPIWQRRGIGITFATVIRSAVDPRTGAGVEANRREIKTDLELPTGDAYVEFIRSLVER